MEADISADTSTATDTAKESAASATSAGQSTKTDESTETNSHEQAQKRHRAMFLFTFTAVCLIWGSTYLGNRFATETIPPLLMAGFRFMIAGSLLFTVLVLRGAVLPTLRQWRSAGIIGVLLITVGNGSFSLSAPHVPSGFASLLATSLPMWTVLIEWLRPNGSRPHNGVVAGLVIGFLGIVWLVQPWNHFGLHTSNVAATGGASGADADVITAITGHLGYIALICAGVITWAMGSIYARHADLPDSPLMGTAVQMLVGGTVMTLLGTVMGNWQGFDVLAISAKSLAALGYLIIFGSIVAFSSHMWLLRNVSPAMTSSYTYINPIIALLLGATLGGETITSSMIIAAAVIIVAVMLVARYRNTPAKA